MYKKKRKKNSRLIPFFFLPARERVTGSAHQRDIHTGLEERGRYGVCTCWSNLPDKKNPARPAFFSFAFFLSVSRGRSWFSFVFLVLNPEISGTHCKLTSPHAMHFTLTLGTDDDRQNYSVAFVFFGRVYLSLPSGIWCVVLLNKKKKEMDKDIQLFFFVCVPLPPISHPHSFFFVWFLFCFFCISNVMDK